MLGLAQAIQSNNISVRIGQLDAKTLIVVGRGGRLGYGMLNRKCLMGNWFYGQHQRAGLLALFLALVFLSGWLRSVVVRDYVEIGNGRFRSDLVVSTDGFLCWGRFIDDEPHHPLSLHYLRVHRFMSIHDSMNSMPIHKSFDPGEIEWNWSFFGAFSVSDPNIAKFLAWGVPYWLFVVPLTLLAAILLLSKPRNRGNAPTRDSRDAT